MGPSVTRFEVTVNGMTFDGLEAGPRDGEPLLLLHGFPQTADSWREVATALGLRGLHVVAPNQRGYSVGARPTRVRAYALDELVSDAFGFIDQLCGGRAHVVGHDWGGIVAWAAAATDASRVRSLTVASTPHPRALARSLPRSLQALRSSYVAFFSTPVLPERLLTLGHGAVLARFLRRSGLPERFAAAYAEALGTPSALRAALSWYRASSRQPGNLSSVGKVTEQHPEDLVELIADRALVAERRR
jgi:pimeloyl-ACP methyl ester carboxylesterase